uniref:BPTI/Kunitz inhibitor domain-containing protein n=1 Tax=Electrophorus electricus TaxID=8005 RepID=A0AAY5F1M3_ELEEL
ISSGVCVWDLLIPASSLVSSQTIQILQLYDTTAHPGVCLLPWDAGTCYEWMSQFYFDSSTSICMYKNFIPRYKITFVGITLL